MGAPQEKEFDNRVEYPPLPAKHRATVKNESTIRDGMRPKLHFRRYEILSKPARGLGADHFDRFGFVRAQRAVPQAPRSREVGGVGAEHLDLEVRLEPEDDLAEVRADRLGIKLEYQVPERTAS